MVLYIVGLGLGDEKDITLRGLECVKKCKTLYLEYYTSVLGVDHAMLEKFYGVPVVLADRFMVDHLISWTSWKLDQRKITRFACSHSQNTSFLLLLTGWVRLWANILERSRRRHWFSRCWRPPMRNNSYRFDFKVQQSQPLQHYAPLYYVGTDYSEHAIESCHYHTVRQIIY